LAGAKIHGLQAAVAVVPDGSPQERIHGRDRPCNLFGARSLILDLVAPKQEERGSYRLSVTAYAPNIGKAFCQEVKWWALGIAALVVVVLAWWILSKAARAYEAWNHRRLFAKIADAETMKEHVWKGHDAHKARK